MNVLVACEFSGVTRDAFIARGHRAMSCDLLPTERPGPHYCGDLFDVIDAPWDLAIFHPECTHLAVSGARHFEAKRMDGRQQAALSFVMRIVRRSEHIPQTCIENPVSIISSLWRRPDQVIQPWMFGHGETKATCLWLKSCPPPATDQHRCRSRCAHPQNAAEPGQVEGPQPHVHRHSRRNG